MHGNYTLKLFLVMYDWTAQSHGHVNSLLKKTWRSSNPVNWNEILQAISMNNSRNFEGLGKKKKIKKKGVEEKKKEKSHTNTHQFVYKDDYWFKREKIADQWIEDGGKKYF